MPKWLTSLGLAVASLSAIGVGVLGGIAASNHLSPDRSASFSPTPLPAQQPNVGPTTGASRHSAASPATGGPDPEKVDRYFVRINKYSDLAELHQTRADTFKLRAQGEASNADAARYSGAGAEGVAVHLNASANELRRAQGAMKDAIYYLALRDEETYKLGVYLLHSGDRQGAVEQFREVLSSQRETEGTGRKAAMKLREMGEW